MSSLVAVTVEDDPLPDFIHCEDDSGEDEDDFPEKEWLWRELKSAPKKFVGGGGPRGRMRYSKQSAPSALCEPVVEGLALDLLVEEDGFVTVNLCVMDTYTPWALSCWELEGLVAMGTTRQQRVRRKRESMWKRVHLESTTSAETAIKDCCESSSSDVLRRAINLVDTANLEQEASLRRPTNAKDSTKMEDVTNLEEAASSHHSSKELQNLDSARLAKSGNQLVEEHISSNIPSDPISSPPDKTCILEHQPTEQLETHTKPKTRLFEWAKSRLRNKQASHCHTNSSWKRIRDNMLCCILGTYL